VDESEIAGLLGEDRAGQDPRGFLASLLELGFRLHTIDRRGRFRPTTIDRLLAGDGAELYLSR